MRVRNKKADTQRCDVFTGVCRLRQDRSGQSTSCRVWLRRARCGKVVMHESIDASAIGKRGRRRSPNQSLSPRRGRAVRSADSRRGEVRIPRELAPLEAQLTKSADQAIAELSRVCTWGTKKNFRTGVQRAGKVTSCTFHLPERHGAVNGDYDLGPCK